MYGTMFAYRRKMKTISSIARVSTALCQLPNGNSSTRRNEDDSINWIMNEQTELVRKAIFYRTKGTKTGRFLSNQLIAMRRATFQALQRLHIFSSFFFLLREGLLCIESHRYFRFDKIQKKMIFFKKNTRKFMLFWTNKIFIHSFLRIEKWIDCRLSTRNDN